MLRSMISVYDNLVFFPETIKRNLYMTQGKNLAEALMIALTKKGASRQEAHEILRTISMQEGDFKQAVHGNSEVKDYLSDEEIDELLVPENYIGEARSLVKRVLDEK
jgi:adenylosuccinate lyase